MYMQLTHSQTISLEIEHVSWRLGVGSLEIEQVLSVLEIKCWVPRNRYNYSVL